MNLYILLIILNLLVFSYEYLYRSKGRRVLAYIINSFFFRIFSLAGYISLSDDKISAYANYKDSYGNFNSVGSHLSYLATIPDYSTLSRAASISKSCGVFSYLKNISVSMFLASCQVYKTMAVVSRELPEQHCQRLRFCSD